MAQGRRAVRGSGRAGLGRASAGAKNRQGQYRDAARPEKGRAAFGSGLFEPMRAQRAFCSRTKSVGDCGSGRGPLKVVVRSGIGADGSGTR